MARRPFRSRLAQRPRSALNWFGSADFTAVSGLASGAAVLDQSLTVGVDATVMRTRGRLFVRTDQQVATEDVIGSLGFAVVSAQALAAGVGSIPTPQTDIASDLWFLYDSFTAGFTRASDIGIANNSWHMVEFDSKAMRKVNSTEAVVVVLENASGTTGLIYTIQFRMLIKVI